MSVKPGSACFRFGPGLLLGAKGDAGALRHLTREYGSAAVTETPGPDVELVFGRTPGEASFADSHKTVRWSVALGSPHERTLRATLAIAGRPRSIAHSLVQGYIAEALVSVAAARRRLVLLPAAAIEQDGRALVLLGRSRSGKSSLMARALAAGRHVLGDDQLLVDASGRCWSFPRRMRVYHDLRVTAPSAYRRLPRARRAALRARRLGAIVSAGWVAPSLAVDLAELGRSPRPGPLPLGGLLLVERAPGGGEPELSALDPDEALAAARRTLADQRSRLRPPSTAWRDELHTTAEREEAMLAGVLGSARLERLTLPEGLGAVAGVSAMARLLAIEA